MSTNTKINGKEYYRIRKVVGHKLVDGEEKPIYKNFYGTSKGNAESKYNDYLKAEAKKKYEKLYARDYSTISDRAEEFITNSLEVSSKYAESTKRRYKSAYECHVKDTWLDKSPVKEIRPADLQRFYNEMETTKSVIKQVNRFMSAFYKWLARNDYGDDVCSCVEIPNKPEKKLHPDDDDITVWDDKSWDKLTSQNFDHRHDLLIKLLCYSGMRIGECLGLKYSDIYDDTIHVVRQYSEYEIKPPKYKSKRDIPLHKKVKEALAVHKEWHKAEMKKNKYKTDYIFTTSHGTLYDVKNLYRAFDRIYKKNGIEHLNFHAYRSTFCTKLGDAGVPIEVASKLLGHKSLEVTARHYAGIKEKRKENAIKKLK